MFDKFVPSSLSKKLNKRHSKLSITRHNSISKISSKFYDDQCIKFNKTTTIIKNTPRIIISDAKEFEAHDNKMSLIANMDDIAFLYGLGQTSPHLLRVPTRSFNPKNINKFDFKQCLSVMAELSKL
uniref:Uncharacterized protein n=1 Tax=Rhabditophanes sp. KR3021 TaxID=114890 RepID=A0AC35U1V3_9BILA